MNKYIPPDFETIQKANAGDSIAMQKLLCCQLCVCRGNTGKANESSIKIRYCQIDGLRVTIKTVTLFLF